MGVGSRAADAGSDRARRIISELGRELRDARRDRNLSLEMVARAAATSPATVSRIERGRVSEGSILLAARIAAAVGLDLSLKLYPAGQPVRDAAHLRLLGSLRARLASSLSMRSEVPLSSPSDRRAWDAVIKGVDWRCGVEAETGPRDVQAVTRRSRLKARDDGVDHLILLLSDTVQSRRFLAAGADALLAEFPIPGELALARLAAGESPGGDAIVVLPASASPRPR